MSPVGRSAAGEPTNGRKRTRLVGDDKDALRSVSRSSEIAVCMDIPYSVSGIRLASRFETRLVGQRMLTTTQHLTKAINRVGRRLSFDISENRIRRGFSSRILQASSGSVRVHLAMTDGNSCIA